MPRKPKENYKQINGRPHAGLHNPKKFGITYEEAVRLVNSGRWNSFYIKWYTEQKRLRNIKLLKSKCPECQQIELDAKNWSPDGKCCRDCHKKQVKTLRCKGCNGRTGAFSFRGELLCERCIKILEELIELSKEEHS